MTIEQLIPGYWAGDEAKVDEVPIVQVIELHACAGRPWRT